VRETPVDQRLLAAGDHNGSTFYQHQGFLELVRNQRAQPSVSLTDGAIAVQMGQAAQLSAATGRAVCMSELTDNPTL
jgi:predicted dehydrogenase